MRNRTKVATRFAFWPEARQQAVLYRVENAIFLRAVLCACFFISRPSLVPGQPLKYETAKGKIRIEGTSNLDDWQVESKSIQGYFEAAEDFSPTLLKTTTAGQKVDVRARVLIPVNTLKSVEKDGKPFSNLMDEILRAKLNGEQHPIIQYRLTDLIIKAPAKGPAEACRCEARGELVVAGVTNQITMPVSVTPIENQHLRLSGQVSVRMTDFQIEPPAPKIALGVVKTGDEVRLSFEWVVVSRRPHP